MQTVLDNIRQILSRIRETWAKLSLNQKVLIGGAVSLIVVAIVILVAGDNRGNNFEALYTELSEKDAADIVTKLEEYKVDYKLVDNGSTILVPADQKYKTRLNLASENLPRGDAGFELFQESGFGETQTDKKVKYQRALQGELARTIQGLHKVKAAKVNLALPEPSLFSENEEMSKASVVIRTEDDDPLTPREVKSIVNLVANSVEKLTPENVVVVDQNGNLVSENLPDEYSDSTDAIKMQMAMKRQYEKEKENAIQTMLDKTLGKDNSVVRVNAELNFDDKEQVDEKYTHDPEGAFVRSEQIRKISSTNSAPGTGGVPGTDNNIPQYTQTNTDNTESSHDESEKIRNYEINKTETITKFSRGDVLYDYLTVSVLVNNSVVERVKLGETEEERAEKIRSIVAAACGLREDRSADDVILDENISVAFIDFFTQPEPEPEPISVLDKVIKSPYLPYVLAVLALAVILLIWLLLRKARREESEMPDDMSGFEAVVEEEINIEDLIDKNLTPEEKEKQKIRQEVDKLVEENPEDVAQVIKAWLSEDI